MTPEDGRGAPLERLPQARRALAARARGGARRLALADGHGQREVVEVRPVESKATRKAGPGSATRPSARGRRRRRTRAGAAHCCTIRAVRSVAAAGAKRTMERDREPTQYRPPSSSTEKSFRLRTPAAAGTSQSASTTYGAAPAGTGNGSPLRPRPVASRPPGASPAGPNSSSTVGIRCLATSRWPFGSTWSDSPTGVRVVPPRRAVAGARRVDLELDRRAQAVEPGSEDQDAGRSLLEHEDVAARVARHALELRSARGARDRRAEDGAQVVVRGDGPAPARGTGVVAIP